jgi:hypothetical protein
VSAVDDPRTITATALEAEWSNLIDQPDFTGLELRHDAGWIPIEEVTVIRNASTPIMILLTGAQPILLTRADVVTIRIGSQLPSWLDQ